MERRAFLLRIGRVLLVAPVAGKLMGCGGDGGEYPPGSSSPEGGGPSGGGSDLEFTVTNTDGSGHSHSFVIKCDHMGADGWAYTAQGGHTHEVWLSKSQLEDVFGGKEVTVETTDGHPHTWIISMPQSACAYGGDGTGGGDPGDGYGDGY